MTTQTIAWACIAGAVAVIVAAELGWRWYARTHGHYPLSEAMAKMRKLPLPTTPRTRIRDNGPREVWNAKRNKRVRESVTWKVDDLDEELSAMMREEGKGRRR